MQRITPERYTTIKTVITAVPLHTKGIGSIYKGMGVSKTIALLIRKSENFKDYKRLANERYRNTTQYKELHKAPSIEPMPEIPADQPEKLDSDLIRLLENVGSAMREIAEAVTEIEKTLTELTGMRANIDFITEHLPVEAKRKFFRE